MGHGLVREDMHAASICHHGVVIWPTLLALSERASLSGATFLAADPPPEGQPGGYDAPEPNDADPYEDFGHSHWHNSLIWGEGLTDIAVKMAERMNIPIAADLLSQAEHDPAAQSILITDDVAFAEQTASLS